MSDLIKKMMERRSCRSYRPDPVPEVMLDEIIQAGLQGQVIQIVLY